MSHVKLHKIKVGDLEFEVTKGVVVISKVRRRGHSLYMLIPSDKARELGVADGDYVISLVSKIVNVRLPEIEERLIEKAREVVEGGER